MARARAVSTLRTARRAASSQSKPAIDVLLLALTGKQASGAVDFGKVIGMIDDMVKLLGQEQTDDDDKKAYCAKQLDQTDDQKKALENEIADGDSAIAAAKDAIATLAKEMAALEAGIAALDKAVAEATAQRKDENAEYKALMSSNTAAKEVLAWAKNRLNKFYNPKLYKAPSKTELSTEDRIYSSMGGAVPTAAPGGIAGTGIAALAQVSMHRKLQVAPPPPPETWGVYASKNQENNGVIAMIDLLVTDLDKEMTEAETDEKDAQAEYEQMMKDSAAKRRADSSSLADKGSAKADTEAALQEHAKQRAGDAKDLMATMKTISALHAECDWLLQYFDARKEARAGEVDSLKRAKAVLSGAQFSLVQTHARNFLGRVRH